MQITGARVRLTSPDGGVLASFTSASGGAIAAPPGGGRGFGMAAIPLIDAQTSHDLRANLQLRTASTTVVAHYIVFGQMGGANVESVESQFVVNVCNGCLVSFPPEASTSPMTYNCNAPGPSPAMGTLMPTLPCAKGQETATDCRLCRGLPACDPKVP